MARRLFDDVIEEKKRLFTSQTGTAYSGFLSPSAAPRQLLSLVAEIETLEAGRRQIEIIEEVRRFPQNGDAFMIPDDRTDLLKEFEQLRERLAVWKGAQS